MNDHTEDRTALRRYHDTTTRLAHARIYGTDKREALLSYGLELLEHLVRAEASCDTELLRSLRTLVGLASVRGHLHEYPAALAEARDAIAKAEGADKPRRL
jgi:hypothetical protein